MSRFLLGSFQFRSKEAKNQNKKIPLNHKLLKRIVEAATTFFRGSHTIKQKQQQKPYNKS